MCPRLRWRRREMPGGRPTDFSAELGDKICAQIAEGKSLRSICKADEMPCTVTVYRWLRSHPEFCNQYARAREDQADAHADEILEIADDSGHDFVDGKDGPVFNSEHVQRSRLRVDARKWIASKLKPKKYGDKVAVGGDEDAPPIRTVTEVILRGVNATGD